MVNNLMPTQLNIQSVLWLEPKSNNFKQIYKKINNYFNSNNVNSTLISEAHLTHVVFNLLSL